jgi:hypothetical protein
MHMKERVHALDWEHDSSFDLQPKRLISHDGISESLYKDS